MVWYRDWFESPYYDTLYQHRDEFEAISFIKKIFEFLPYEDNSKILDLACGNGRHALALSQFGKVVGLDINPSQIAKAQARNINNANFALQDMRESFGKDAFDYVFNIFSSFGYFEDTAQDLISLENVAQALKPGGFFIHDFLNRDFVLTTFKSEIEVIQKDTLRFEIYRKLEDDFIIKTIKIFDNQNELGNFEEKVRAYDKKRMIDLHHKAGMEVCHIFGDYDLNTYDELKSPRLILISQKP